MMYPTPRKGDYKIARFMSMTDKFCPHPILREDHTYKHADSVEIIMSLFEGIDIGEVICSNKGETYLIINGGHRVRAIKLFMRDDLKVIAPTTNDLRKYSELCEQDKRQFDDTKIFVTVYSDLTPIQEEVICKRVNHAFSMSHGEFVRVTQTAPMCMLAQTLSEQYKDTLSHVKHVVGTKGDARLLSYSWTLTLLANFHHGKVLYGRKLTPLKNKELCESLRNMPIDEQRLTRRFEKLMLVIDSKQTNLKYPSYVLATAQAILLSNAQTRAQLSGLQTNEIAKFLDDMLVNIRSGPLRTRWDALAHTKGLDPNLPSSCYERVNILLDWHRRDSSLLPTLPDSDSDSDSDSDTPFHVGDFVWVVTEGPSDKCELARVLACFPDGTVRVEWWYRGWKSKPCASIPDEAWSLITEEDLVLDNDNVDIIDADCIKQHADRFVHEKARKKFMWTRPAPGRKCVYKVIDTIRKKDSMWTPSPDQRAFARTQFEDSVTADAVIDSMKCDDYKDFIKQLNGYLALTQGRKRKRE